jgi:hypothetical protein
LPIPIVSIRNGAGPVVLVMAGNHGDEYEGQIVASDRRQFLLASAALSTLFFHTALQAAQTAVDLSARQPGRIRAQKPSDLLPVFEVNGEECFLDTPGMTAVPLNAPGKCIGSLSDRREAILAALDRFGAY